MQSKRGNFIIRRQNAWSPPTRESVIKRLKAHGQTKQHKKDFSDIFSSYEIVIQNKVNFNSKCGIVFEWSNHFFY